MNWGDYLTIEYGKPVPDKDAKDGAVPVFGTNGQIGTSHLPAQCGIPSFVVGRKGAYRGVHFSPVPFSVIDTAFYALPLTDKVDLKWAYYKFLTYDINRMDSGSAIPSTDRYELYRIPVDIPELGVQKRVVKVLDSIEDIIKKNQEINDNLEQQAQALFKSWFIDYEPFELEPSTETGKLRIPIGWELRKLAEITTNIRTRVKDRQCKVLSAVNSGSLQLSEDYFTKQVFSKDISGYILVEENDFAYNPSRVNIGSIGMNDLGVVGCVSPVYVVFRVEPNYQYFFDFFIKSPRFKEEVKTRASGSVRQAMNYSDFGLITVSYPPIEIIKQFNTLYLPIKRYSNYLREESKKLSDIRDSLLPRLMSGEIDVSSIDI